MLFRSRWLLDSPPALEELLGSGEVVDQRWPEAVEVFDRILTADPAAKSGLQRRIAVATALTFAQPVTWMADGSAIDPVARYRSFVQWDQEGVLFPSFRDLSTWELRYVVGSWSSDADLVWAREHIKPELKVRDRVGDGFAQRREFGRSLDAAIVPDALGHLEPEMTGDKRLGEADAQVEKIVAPLHADIECVTETLRDQHRGRSTAPLDHRVGHQGRSMDDSGDVGDRYFGFLREGAYPVDHRGRLMSVQGRPWMLVAENRAY